MPRGLSLHIGLNYVDASAYGGWSGVLGGCEADAEAWRELAENRGFAAISLINGLATSSGVVGEILSAAEQLGPGDMFLLTYSGHGGQVPDRNNDEPDGMDETWCLFDRQLLDDEIFAALAQFPTGCRVVVVSDSCHSGTVTRAAALETSGSTRLAPAYACKANFDSIENSIVDGVKGMPVSACELRCPVLLLSACQDNQTAGDDGGMGVFSRAAMGVWGAGWKAGDYRRFRARIAAKLPMNQSPNLFTNGPGAKHLERSVPFTI